MFRFFSRIFIDHDLPLVAFAGILCLLSCTAAIMLLRRAVLTDGFTRWIWLASAGTAGGFGIWATHFFAMLAFDTQIVIGYELYRTLFSLLIAIATTFAAVAFAVLLPGRAGSAASGMLFGLGVSTMHFVGMTAIEFPGTIVWDATLVRSAILLAVIFSVPGFLAATPGRTWLTGVPAAGALLTLGIISMHFTAMAAVTLNPLTNAAAPAGLLSPTFMVVVIAATAFSLLFSVLAAAFFAIRAEYAAAASDANFRLLVQGVTDYAIYMLDPTGKVSNWNAGAARAKGYTAQEIVGQDFSLFYSAEDRARGVPARALQTALSNGKFETEGWRYRKDGTSFWASVVIDPIYNEDGIHIGFAKITRDCTEKMRSAAELKDVSNNLSIALNTMANAICLYDSSERLVLHNERTREIFGTPADVELRGKTFRDLCVERYEQDIGGGGDAETFYREHRALFTRPEGGEHVRALANGRIVRTIHRPTGDGSFVSTIEDITDRVRSEEQIRHLARHDALTGLPNRRQFVDRLDATIAAVEGTTKVAAVCIDLDGFKEINDRFGHAAGDTVLCELARRMQATIRDDEAVGRFGGDEFAALKRFTQDQDLEDFIARLSRALTARIAVGENQIAPGASIGVSVYPTDACDREKLLNNADMAMYRSKASSDERISFYEVGMDEAARERRAMGRDLWKALEEGQFFLVYQVQKSARTEAITGYEVLLRWRHPVHGLVSPGTFIPVAEECGAISAIGDWVLEQACREAVELGLEHKIAVNLSALQLGNVSLVEKVRAALLKTGLSPSLLELEVTESAIIGDKGRALHILRQIKAMGVTIAIDDFGTGYSSLETLRSFPFDKIKLDRSFVSELESRQSKAFVRAIVALGKSLDVTILAEGVETVEQLQVLIAEECDEVQGFLFGRPGAVEKVLEGQIVPRALTA